MPNLSRCLPLLLPTLGLLACGDRDGAGDDPKGDGGAGDGGTATGDGGLGGDGGREPGDAGTEAATRSVRVHLSLLLAEGLAGRRLSPAGETLPVEGEEDLIDAGNPQTRPDRGPGRGHGTDGARRWGRGGRLVGDG